MPEPVPLRMTSDAFIAWAMEQPEGQRFELEGGEVIAMAPERIAHTLVKGLFFRRMAEEVERLGLQCTALTDGMAVEVDAHTVYEPDALLRCGPSLPDDTVKLSDPLVVVEVLSRATRARDSGVKLMDYFRLASLRHYLIVRIEDRAVIHHERDAGDAITTRVLREGPVRLDPPGIVLSGLFPPDIPHS